MKVVNHAAISKTENFVQMKTAAQAIKIMIIAVVEKTIQLSQKVVPVDKITVIHAPQCHKYAILAQYANNLAVIGILVENLVVISILVEDLVLIKTLVEDVIDSAIVYVDFKDILIQLAKKLLVYFEIG